MEDQRAEEVWYEYQKQKYGPNWQDRYRCNCNPVETSRERTAEEISADIEKQMECTTLQITERLSESLREQLRKTNNVHVRPISKFVPHPVETYFLNVPFCCGCNCRQDINVCRDCHFYEEEHDMGVTIPWCNKHRKIIDEIKDGCKFRITRKEVRSLVDKFLEDR